MLDEQSGITKSKSGGLSGFDPGMWKGKKQTNRGGHDDSGGASRFFYCAKTSKKDRTENGQIINKHPTVKPTDLIKYLIKLVTPPNGICLDVCEGSGTHAKASILLTKEGYPVQYIGFENDIESYNTSLERIKANKLNPIKN